MIDLRSDTVTIPTAEIGMQWQKLLWVMMFMVKIQPSML